MGTIEIVVEREFVISKEHDNRLFQQDEQLTRSLLKTKRPPAVVVEEVVAELQPLHPPDGVLLVLASLVCGREVRI
jgi:hypothetical protein